MTDQPTTETPISNAAAVIEKAKQVADRYNRQVTFLLGLNIRLPILKSALAYATKMAKEHSEDRDRLTLEVAAAEKHIEQLTVWTAKNMSMPDDVATANSLADKIKRLQKDIERRRIELQRMEESLAETKAG